MYGENSGFGLGVFNIRGLIIGGRDYVCIHCSLYVLWCMLCPICKMFHVLCSMFFSLLC